MYNRCNFVLLPRHVFTAILLILSVHIEAQDYWRFLKVKGWEVHYEIEKKTSNDNSFLISNSKVTGDCLMDEKFDRETWNGKGRIKYSFDEKSAGTQQENEFYGGSKFYGFVYGQGETELFSDDSFIAIYPDEGSCELLMIHGNEERTGMEVLTFSDNSMWHDIMANMQRVIGSQDADAAANQIKEVMEKIPSTKDDAINALSDRYFIFSLEDIKLPTSGLIIEGETVIPGNFKLIWKIIPID